MNNIITPLKDLLAEAAIIQDFLEEPITDDMEAVIERGNNILAYIARTGKMKADARFHKDIKTRSSIMQQLKEMSTTLKLPASTMNNLVNAMCEEENHLLEWCDRLNRTSTHQLDWLRTLVSKEKEEMRLRGGISNT